MCKSTSGLFFSTKGNPAAPPAQLTTPVLHINTSIVWYHLKATQENYSGTVIPRSFEIDVPVTPATPEGKLWTHGNATEHMYEAAISVNKHAPTMINSNPDLYSQFILYDYYKSLGKAIKQGKEFGKMVSIGNWEFIIVKPRAGQKYPVVKHALFTGLKKGVNL